MSTAVPTYRLVGYFSASAAFDKKLHVADSNLPADRLTHLVYAFATVTTDGICASINTDIDAVNFPQLATLKQQFPSLSVLLSIGGAAHSASFSTAAATDASRLKLAQSCVAFMKTHGFDGIDIDWEFPAAADKANFTALLTALRTQLGTQGKTDNRSYLLTIAAPAGPSNYANFDLTAIQSVVDWVNLMTYDYAVATSKTTGLVAPLFAPPDDPSASTGHPAENVDASVAVYLSAGVPSSKLVLGVRFVGTGWQGVPNVNNGLFQTVTPPTSGGLSVGSVAFGDLETTYLPTYPRYWHSQALVPWLYNPANNGVCISYEDAQSLAIKANYALSKDLGGVMIWDLNADDAQQTLINSLAGVFQAGADGTYAVVGTVTSPVRAGVGGLQVQIVDKNVGGDVVLTSTRTSSLGTYRASVVIAPAALRARQKTRPDLQARVWAGSTFQAASVVEYNAANQVQLDVALPNPTVLPSEYETLTEELAKSYSGPLGALQENDDRQDITFLANKLGWDARAVAMAALADGLSKLTAAAPTGAATTNPLPPAGTAPPPAGTAPPPAPAPVGLQPAFYYALLRAGLPGDADGLFRTGSGTVQAIWNQAIAQGVIPPSLATQVPQAVKTFQALSAVHILTALPPVGLSTMQDMLAPTLTSAADQQTFASLFTQYRDDWTNFWPAVQKALGAGPAQALQFAGQLYYLTINNAPLVSALTRAESQKPLTATVDLATRGYYDPAKWTPLIGTAIPQGIPGASADEKRSNYAQLLAAQVRVAHPTAVVADQIGRGLVPIPDTQHVANDVVSFLTTYQADFAIGVQPVDRYIAVNNITGTSAAVRSHIQRIQRVYQLTQDDASMSVLLQRNHDSAYAITRYSEAGFVRAFQTQIGGADKAMAIHARAKQVFNTVLNIATSYAHARIAPTLGPVTMPFHQPFPSPQPAQNNPVIAYPTLEDLFGSLDYCNCSDCRSILSPAAYLVDLLNYLDQPSATPGFKNPQDVLFARRPDLQYLPLTCENTNTALPYIDIVNETLEYYVADGLTLANYQGHDTGSDVTSAELLASPQYANDAAYATLQSAFFPPPLPFNRPLALLRLHMQNLRVALPDAMIALRGNDALVDPSTPTSYGWSDILIEQLGISRDEYRLFADTTLGLSDLYGISQPPAQVLSTLQAMNLQDFSRRVGVSYVDLSTILLTQFINPDAVLIPRLQKLNAPFSALKALHDNLGTAQSIAASFITALPAGLDATQYGGTAPDDYQAVVTWVTDPKIYPRIMNLIALTSTAGNSDSCSGAAWALRYSNPDNTANSLSATDFLKLIRFIRLWQKLTPLLGSSDDSTTIVWIDEILAALYPANKLPVASGTIANDPTNRPLLDAGFQTLLRRVGFLFQVMNQLSLTAVTGLEQLLACWAPLGTVGANSIYQRMFLTPTLLQQDPGAQTATVSDIVKVGDTLETTINGVAIAPHIVATGENATTVAAAAVTAINGTTTVDPATSPTNLRLNQRIFATSNGGIITIKAGFTLTCAVTTGTGETYTAAATSPLSQTATVAGTLTPGHVLTTTINGVPIPYTIASGDTPASVAANIRDAINSATYSDPYSGLPLNSLVAASSSGAVIALVAANAGAPFTLTCSLKPGTTGSYSTGNYVPASFAATVGGTINTSVTLTTTFSFMNSGNNVVLSYTVTATDITAELLAASVAAAINASAQQDPTTSLQISELVHATSSGTTVTIRAVDPTTPFAVSANASQGATYTATGPTPAKQVAIATGSLPVGTVLTTIINGLSLYYTVAAGDGPSSIAANIVTAINVTTTADPITNLALNTVVTATHINLLSGGTTVGQVIVSAKSPLTPFTLSVAFTASGYTAGQKTPPFADDGYGDYLTDLTQFIFGHQPTLCAACNLTGAEFSQIATALGFVATTPLTLANVSMMFRCGWLPHTLEMSVLVFLKLRQFSGLDPFDPVALLDPAPNPPVEPPVIRFLRLTQAMSTAGLQAVQALYLMWNQDISGNSAPPVATITGLAAALRADFAAVEAQFIVKDDPDGTISQGLMTLVYGSSATDFFFGLLNNTATPPAQSAVSEFFATYPELQPFYAAFVASTDPIPVRRQSLLAHFLPVLEQARKQEQAGASITAAAGTDPSFAAAFLTDPAVLHADAVANAAAVVDLTAIEATGLAARFFLGNDPTAAADQSVDAVDPFSYFPTATLGGTITVGDVMTTTINGLAIPYKVGAGDTSLTILAGNIAAAINATTALDSVSHLPINQLVSATSSGAVVVISAVTPWKAGGVFSLACSVSASATETYTARSQLPVGKGGGPIAGVWTGYLNVPQDGSYSLAISADAAAQISLQMDGTIVAGTASGGLWQTQSPISLVAGALVPIVLTATSIKTMLVVSWQSTGLGWEVIPGDFLYSRSLVDRLAHTYVRFLKASSLAQALSLTADEIAYLGTPTNPGWLNWLSATGDPDPATSVRLCGVLIQLLDFARMKQGLSPNDQRLLTVLQNPAATLPNSTQSALLSLTGWDQISLSALLTRFFGNNTLSNLSDIEKFRRTYDAYAIVQTCRVSAAALISAVTNAPTASKVGALQSALRALYAEANWLTVVQPINDAMRINQRDALVAYILQQKGDVYAGSLVNQTTNAAAATGASTLNLGSVSGLTIGMPVKGLNIAPGTVVNAVSPSANTVTLNTGTLGAVPSGTPLTFVPANAVEIATSNDLFEYFLIDAETQPAVQTSRIRLALSSVQLFIERIVRNLEPQVSPADIDATQWETMKRYRVWQANREVFLWPENWLYPELRDDQSPFFQQIMSSLLQSDITDDAASEAYLDYLSNLESVAKLEPCGLYYTPCTPLTDEVAYVVARTAGAHRKYYFRELQYASWTPWTEVAIDCEDMPLTPIVWNGRLFLFWLKVLKQIPPAPPVTLGDSPQLPSAKLSDFQSYGTALAQGSGQVGIQAVLCYSEFYNGKWQPTKTSDVNQPTNISGLFDPTGPGSFDVDRNRVRIVPANYSGSGLSLPQDALILAIVLADDLTTQPLPFSGGFILYNSHSLPVRLDDVWVVQQHVGWTSTGVLTILLDTPDPSRTLLPNYRYTGANDSDPPVFSINYFTSAYDWYNPSMFYTSPYAISNVLGFPGTPRFVEPQIGLADAWDAPFFYEDRQNIYYVTTVQNIVPIVFVSYFGRSLVEQSGPAAGASIPGTSVSSAPTASGGSTGGSRGKLRVTLASTGTLTYQGTLVAASGSITSRSAAKSSSGSLKS